MKQGPALRYAGIVVLVAGASLLAGGQPRAPELALLDARFLINRAAGVASPSAPVVFAAITPQSEQRLGRVFEASWREWYPQMIRTLHAAGAAGIVWDATFVASEPEYDPELADALSLVPNIAVENRTDRNNVTLAPHFWRLGWKQMSTPLNVPRRTIANTRLPALGSVAADLAQHAGLAERTRADTAQPLWLDYSFNPETEPTVDIADLILGNATRLADEAATPTSIVTDRIVFVGLDMPGEDRYPMPGTGSLAAPGVYAHIVSMWSYLSDREITRVGGWGGRGLVLLPGLAVVLATRVRRRTWRRIAGALGVALAILLPPIVFATHRIWIPWFGMLVVTLLAVIAVAVDRRLLLARNYRSSLGFDPALIERYGRVIESTATGIERPATVLCVDIRGYTQFVNDNAADEVQQVMTRYMSRMEDVVHRHGGYINKFVGDEIVAVFGFPLQEDHTERRATECAHNMIEELIALNAQWSVDGLPLLEGIGVGIDSGQLRFTNIGGDRRIQFDVIGGPVNGASRLQALTKQLDCSLIASATVAEQQTTFGVEQTIAESTGAPASGAAHEGPVLSFLGEVMIRGQGRRRLFGLARTHG